MQVSIIFAFTGFRRAQSKSLVIYVAVESAAILRATRCKTTVSSWKYSRLPLFLFHGSFNNFHCDKIRFNMFLIWKIRHGWFFLRLFETHPNIQDTFPTFKGVSLDELMNSRSLYLHAKRVMAAVESTISALDDAEVLVESLTNLGRRHRCWSIREEHFKVLKVRITNLGLEL